MKKIENIFEDADIKWSDFLDVSFGEGVYIFSKIKILAYHYNDVSTLEFANDVLHDTIASTKIEQQLISKYNDEKIMLQNQDWIESEELIQNMKNEKTAIFIGHRHLFGESGLVKLLKNKEFEVTEILEDGMMENNDKAQKKYAEELQMLQNELFKLCVNAFENVIIFFFFSSTFSLLQRRPLQISNR